MEIEGVTLDHYTHEVLGNLEQEHGKTIRVVNGRGRPYTEVVRDGEILIVSWGIPEGPPTFVKRERIAIGGGTHPTIDADVLLPSGRGNAIEDSDGVVFIEVRSGIVWSLFELSLNIGRSISQLLREAVDSAADETLSEQIDTERNTSSIDAFVEAAGSYRHTRIEALNNETHNYECHIAESQREQIDTRRKLDEAKHQLDAAVNFDSERDRSASDQWEALEAHATLNELRYENGWLSAYTKPLEISDPIDPKRTAPLGSFVIRINPTENRIKVLNLDGKRGDRDHPHVTNGTPCWGSVNDSATKLLAQANFEGLIDLTIAYLHNYNPEDSDGKYAAWWFENQNPEIQTEGE